MPLISSFSGVDIKLPQLERSNYNYTTITILPPPLRYVVTVVICVVCSTHSHIAKRNLASNVCKHAFTDEFNTAMCKSQKESMKNKWVDSSNV